MHSIGSGASLIHFPLPFVILTLPQKCDILKLPIFTIYGHLPLPMPVDWARRRRERISLMNSNDVCEKVNADLALNRQLLDKIRRELPSLPAGSLCCKTVRGKQYYYQYQYLPSEQTEGSRSEKQRYLSSKDASIRSALTQKAYCRAAAKLLSRNVLAAEEFLAEYTPYDPSDIWASLPAVYRQDPQRSPAAVQARERDAAVRTWLSEETNARPPYPDHLIYRSPQGLPVRSKSESLIAAMLDARRIPFRYEAPLPIDDKLFFPDFTILRRSDHQIFYWEHFGMMDDETYRQHACDKLRYYAEAGILPFKNLIATYESQLQPFNAARIDRILRTLLV